MHVLGFRYEAKKKHFYVDTHKAPEVVKYRDEVWGPRYMERELRMHRWIRMSVEEAKVFIEKGEIGEGQGHRFTCNGEERIEYHVDDHPTFLELGAAAHRFGGLLSVRMPPNVLPIMLFGQDEAIFKQYLSHWKAWTAPGGLKAISPKDDGLAVMISAIVSRKLGFGVEWNEDIMKKVNERRVGKNTAIVRQRFV